MRHTDDAQDAETAHADKEEPRTDDPEVTEKVERTDVGVSITAELKRGTGTRDQDKLTGKVKAETLEEARDDMDDLKDDMEEWAEDLRAIQPDADGDGGDA